MNMKLHPDLDVKISDVMLLILVFYTRHNLTNIALVDLLQIINIMFGVNRLPKTYATFMKQCGHISRDTFKYQKHFYCQNCKLYLGTEKERKICSNCSTVKQNYFVTNNIIQQLRDILTKNWEAIKTFKASLNRNNFINDISNGKFVKHLEGTKFTLSFNLDGIATFKSNIRRSLWPIIITINDLPPKLRFLNKNCIIAGLWLDYGEPVMDIFLKPFCETMKQISSAGIQIKNEICRIKCVCCCVDSVARCKILNAMQFNGKFGCTYCKQSPERTSLVNGRTQLRYVFKEIVELRSLSDHLDSMKEAHISKRPVFGVKGLSCLVSIPDFDLTQCLPVDYMHALMLGVVKTVNDLWLDTKNNKKPYYIGNRIKSINARIDGIHPFTELSHYPRDINCRSQWKAHEWETWLLYISPVCLLDILQKVYYDHILLLRKCVSILLSDNITSTIIDECEADLLKFVGNYETYYGKENMVYNIHLVTHICENVRNFGPLWNFSLYAYENVNGTLKKYIKSPNEPMIQVVQKRNIFHCLHHGYFSKNCNHDIISFCEKLMSPSLFKYEAFKG